MLDPDLGAIIVAGVALLLLTASAHKWRAQREFKQVLQNYRLFPAAMLGVLTPGIPALEAVLAVALLVPATRQGAAWGALTLLLLYAAGIGVNLLRGRVTMDCGCVGPAVRRPIGRWMVIRNLVIGLAAGVAGAPWAARPPGLLDAFTVGAGLVVVGVLYVAVDNLLGRGRPQPNPLRSSA